MITCAITGSSGVLGSKLKKKIPIKFYEFRGDVTNKKQVHKWIMKKNFDIFIHLAAMVPTNLVNKNYQKDGTTLFCEFAIIHPTGLVLPIDSHWPKTAYEILLDMRKQLGNKTQEQIEQENKKLKEIVKQYENKAKEVKSKYASLPKIIFL